MRLDRDDDFVLTGKRHDFLTRYDVGFDEEGMVQAIDLQLDARCGYSADLTIGGSTARCSTRTTPISFPRRGLHRGG